MSRRFRILFALCAAAGVGFVAFACSIVARHATPATLGDSLGLIAVGVVMAGVGVLVGLAKPEAPSARAAAIGLYAAGVVWMKNALVPYFPTLTSTDHAVIYVMRMADPLQLIFGYRFFLRFAPGVSPPPLLVGGRWFVDIGGAFYWLCARLEDLLRWVDLGAVGAAAGAITVTRPYYTGLALLGICIACGWSYRRARDIDARRRVRWIVAGTLVALVPEMFGSFAKAAFHWDDSVLPTRFTVVALPLTFAYAILKHRILDIQVAIRRTVQYLVARNALRVLVALPAVLLLVDIVGDPNRTVRQLFFDSWPRLALLVLAATALRFHRPLQRFIDRVFFHTQANLEETLDRLHSQLKGADSMSDVAAALEREVEVALKPRTVRCFAAADDRLPATLAHRYEREDGPSLSDEERGWLDSMGGKVVVPMRSTDERLLGLLVLGDKRSEEPYSPSDRKLLFALAAQMSFVLEARSLRERVAAVARERGEALARLHPLLECRKCGTCADDGDVCPTCGGRLEMGLAVERILDGKYRLDRRIGTGGMSAVFRARDLRLQRDVAVKILVGGRLGDPAGRRRFAREARTTARLRHPYIVAVHDFGELAPEGAYLVMELLEGTTLRAELRRWPAPEGVAVWFGQICTAIAAAHEAGVVHRDLKPDNVFVTRTGNVKVLDFGLARLTQPGEASAVTIPGVLLGTIGYMAPEQLQGGEADAAADIFALGVMVFEAIAGVRPFGGRNLAELTMSLLHDEVHLPAGAPAALADLVARCLARDPARRPRAAELVETLPGLLATCPPLRPPDSLPSADTQRLD